MIKQGRKISPNDLIPVTFTLEQRDLLLGHTPGSVPVASLIDETFRAGVVRGDTVVVKMQLFEIEDLLGCIAFESRHNKNRSIVDALDEIYYPLDALFQAHR